MYSEFIEAGAETDKHRRALAIKSLVCRLPATNYSTIKCISRFLKVVSQYSKINKMTSANLGIVLGPNVLRPKEETMQTVFEMPIATGVLATMIDEYALIFDDVNGVPIPDLTKLTADGKLNNTQYLQEDALSQVEKQQEQEQQEEYERLQREQQEELENKQKQLRELEARLQQKLAQSSIEESKSIDDFQNEDIPPTATPTSTPASTPAPIAAHYARDQPAQSFEDKPQPPSRPTRPTRPGRDDTISAKNEEEPTDTYKSTESQQDAQDRADFEEMNADLRLSTSSTASLRLKGDKVKSLVNLWETKPK